MRYYIVKRAGDLLAVTNVEPDMAAYVEGPFLDREDAFERMQELDSRRRQRDAVWEVFSGIALFGGLLLLLMLWMQGGEW